MAWLFLLLAFGALWVAFTAASPGVVALGLVVALVLFVLFVLKLAADKVGSRSREQQMILDPEELRRLREQAEARKLATTASSELPR